MLIPHASLALSRELRPAKPFDFDMGSHNRAQYEQPSKKKRAALLSGEQPVITIE
jgi:hypothetical protein